MSLFMRELGISARSCSALLALRIRASMSATGSVSISHLSGTKRPDKPSPGENAQHFSRLLPRTLGHARDHALVRELAQADPAEAELLEHRSRPAAAVAARVRAHREFLRARLLDPKRFLCHYCCSLSAKGSPRPRRSASAWASVFAVV